MSDMGSGVHSTLEANESDSALGGHNKDYQGIEQLQQELRREKDARNEERVLWAVAIVVLLDIACFPAMETWTGPIVIGVFELFGLVVFARQCGEDTVWTLTEKLIDSVTPAKKSD